MLLVGAVLVAVTVPINGVRDFLEIVATLGLAAAILSLGAAETASFTVALTEWLLTKRDEARARVTKLQEEARSKGRAEGRAEGRVKGRAEGRAEGYEQAAAEWSAWNARREEAEQNGGGFQEPPPGVGHR